MIGRCGLCRISSFEAYRHPKLPFLTGMRVLGYLALVSRLSGTPLRWCPDINYNIEVPARKSYGKTCLSDLIGSGETPRDAAQSSERAGLLVETVGLKKLQLYDSLGLERDACKKTYMERCVASYLATQSADVMYVDVVIARACEPPTHHPPPAQCLSTFIT